MFFCFKHHRSFLVLLTLALPLVSNAQQSDWETGNIQVQEQDTAYINELLEKADNLRSSKPDSALSLSNLASQLSDRINYPKGKAGALKIMGLVNYDLGEYVESFDLFEESLDVLKRTGDTVAIANLTSNIGSLYLTIGDNPNALEYYINSLRYAKALSDTLRIGTAYLNIAVIYQEHKETYPEATKYYKLAFDMFDSAEYTLGVAGSKVNFGEWLFEQGNPQEGIPFLKDALEGFKELGFYEVYALNALGQAYLNLGQYPVAEDYFKQALNQASEKLNKEEETKTYLGLGNLNFELDNFSQAINYYKKALELAVEMGVLEDQLDGYSGLSKTYAAINDFKNGFEAKTKYQFANDSLNALKIEEEKSKIRSVFIINEQLKEKRKLEEDLIKELEAKRQKTVTYITVGALLILVVFIIGLYRRFLFVRNTKNIIEQEKSRSDNLLKNILPEETAEELKLHGATKARKFDLITVLFTDFKEFSLIAENETPENIVASVDYYFKHFDAIVEKYGLEKIKTIGDAYMCAGGIPSPNETHAEDAMKAAIEICDFVEQTRQNPPGQIRTFEVRIGLNSGPVVAGVVGTKKFAYDIWGSTVNFAARMESNSEPGRINVSESTYRLLTDKYDFTYRGDIEVKNGQILKMYFAEIESQVAV